MNFIGTNDFVPLTIRVGSQPALRIIPSANTNTAANLVGGHINNSIAEDIEGATIAGGGNSVLFNQVTENYATVSGGPGNRALASQTTIAGGRENVTSGTQSVISGGWQNSAVGDFSTVSGGRYNCAGANWSWVGGRRAKVRPGESDRDLGVGCDGLELNGFGGDPGTFIWADGLNTDFVSGGHDQFLVRAGGGAVFTSGEDAVNFAFGNQLRVDELGTGDAFETLLCRNVNDQVPACANSPASQSDLEQLKSLIHRQQAGNDELRVELDELRQRTQTMQAMFDQWLEVDR